MNSILRTFLWYPTRLGEALDFYQSVFGDQMKVAERNLGENGEVFTADFSIYGHDFIGMSHEGGPAFNDSVSLSISCDGQEETDRLWEALTADGGEKGRCGWCKDKFGVSWQVTPIQMRDWVGHSDPEVQQYAWQALMNMNKIVIEELHR